MVHDRSQPFSVAYLTAKSGYLVECMYQDGVLADSAYKHEKHGLSGRCIEHGCMGGNSLSFGNYVCLMCSCVR